jgi:hypothetical protein
MSVVAVVAGLTAAPSALAQVAPTEFVIQLSSNQATFGSPTGIPDVIEATPAIEIVAGGRDRQWLVQCQASPLLRLDPGGGATPGARLFLGTTRGQSAPDTGAGPGLVDLSGPRVVAARQSATDAALQTDTLRLRLKTTWEDRPGQYRGEIRFVYLAVPSGGRSRHEPLRTHRSDPASSLRPQRSGGH